MNRMNKYFWLTLCWVFSIYGTSLNAQLVINEICGDNDTILEDEDGDYSDWIEIYNPSASAVSLKGYSLSDDRDDPRKWNFPDVIINPRAFILVFASGKDKSTGEMHTNFKISKGGEPLSLYNIDNETIIDQIDVPPLEQDHSFGHQPDGFGEQTYFPIPTPNASNNDSPNYDFATPPVFETSKSFHTGSASIILSCAGTDCEIHYTLDGSIPDQNSLLLYWRDLAGYDYGYSRYDRRTRATPFSYKHQPLFY